jgi:DNA repair protein RadC
MSQNLTSSRQIPLDLTTPPPPPAERYSEFPFQVADQPGHNRVLRPVSAEEVIEFAFQIIAERCKPGVELTSVAATRRYLVSKLSAKESEVFACIFLDNRHRVIAYQELFFGTIDGASVHPREVVKQSLRYNAAALIVSHNHPSGVAEPSSADCSITQRLREALELIDVRLLDHVIVAGTETVSLAERGLL